MSPKPGVIDAWDSPVVVNESNLKTVFKNSREVRDSMIEEDKFINFLTHLWITMDVPFVPVQIHYSQLDKFKALVTKSDFHVDQWGRKGDIVYLQLFKMVQGWRRCNFPTHYENVTFSIIFVYFMNQFYVLLYIL